MIVSKTILLACFLLFLAVPGLQSPSSANTAEQPVISLVDRYRRALEVDPDNLKLRYYLGVALLGRGQTADALIELRLAYPAFQDSVEANYNLGIACLQAGDNDSAVLHLEQAEALGATENPDIYPLVDAYYNLAVINFEQDKREEAIRLFKRVLAMNPERREVERLLGDMYARNGQDDLALAAFNRYLGAFPDDVSIREYVFSLHFNYAMKMLEKEDLVASREALRHALGTSPESPLAQYYLGYIDYREARLDAAVTILHRAYRWAEGDVRQGVRELLYNVALQLLEQRKAKSALDALRVILVASDVTAEELFLAGNIHLLLSEFVAARDSYEAVLRKDPVHQGAILNLVTAEAGALDALFADGRRCYDQQDYRAALSRFEEMLKINPADPRARNYSEDCRSVLTRQAESFFAAATALIAQNKPLPALEEVRQGLRLIPAHPTGSGLEKEALVALRAQIEATLANADAALADQRFADAEAAYLQALQLEPENVRGKEGRQAVARLRLAYAEEQVRQGESALGEGKLDLARLAFVAAQLLEPALRGAEEGLAKTDALVSSLVIEELRWARRAGEAGRLTEARKHFHKALQLREDPEIRAELAELDAGFNRKITALVRTAGRYADQQEFQRARNIYRQVLTQVPDHTEATLGLAQLEQRATQMVTEKLAVARELLRDNQFRQAMESYRQVVDIEPGNTQAISGLEECRTRSQAQLQGLLTSADTALQGQDWSRAENYYQQVLKLDPYQRQAKAGIEKLDVLRRKGLQAVDLDTLYLDGIKYYTGGQYAEAITAWQQVLQLNPEHEKARRNLEKAQRKQQFIKDRHDG
ncbi:MAG: tetratricopeptide repeat protein [Desulfuromonadaceae bacterium]|nr:tetratricopeptide repeat protein [Desulfuromonadaceae bacterium]